MVSGYTRTNASVATFSSRFGLCIYGDTKMNKSAPTAHFRHTHNESGCSQSNKMNGAAGIVTLAPIGLGIKLYYNHDHSTFLTRAYAVCAGVCHRGAEVWEARE